MRARLAKRAPQGAPARLAPREHLPQPPAPRHAHPAQQDGLALRLAPLQFPHATLAQRASKASRALPPVTHKACRVGAPMCSPLARAATTRCPWARCKRGARLPAAASTQTTFLQKLNGQRPVDSAPTLSSGSLPPRGVTTSSLHPPRPQVPAPSHSQTAHRCTLQTLYCPGAPAAQILATRRCPEPTTRMRVRA